MPLERATDLDEAENGTVVEYRLVDVDKDDSAIPFKLVMDTDSGTGSSIYVELASQLDHELKNAYELQLVALDGGTPRR